MGLNLSLVICTLLVVSFCSTLGVSYSGKIPIYVTEGASMGWLHFAEVYVSS